MATDPMPFLVGIDEAGYGPTLGPLVVSAAEFSVADPEVDLWSALAPVVHRKPARGALTVCDSKLLYRPAGGLAPLERSALAFASNAVGLRRPQEFFDPLDFEAIGPTSARDFLHTLTEDAPALFESAPWYREIPLQLPIEEERPAVAHHAARLAYACGQAKVRFERFRLRVCDARHFNTAVRNHGNKSGALFALTAGLLKPIWQEHGHAGVLATCGKHGGRMRYRDSLASAFPGVSVTMIREASTSSVYRLAGGGRTMVCSFLQDAEEAHFGVAIASCMAKYTREVAMRCFNGWWTTKVPGLKPTAGYPEDARRFLAETSSARLHLRFEDGDLIRSC